MAEMQIARPDISDFVKSAPPDFKNPESCPALVLNADFRPLSYYPLSLWAWQDTLKAVHTGEFAHWVEESRTPSELDPEALGT